MREVHSIALDMLAFWPIKKRVHPAKKYLRALLQVDWIYNFDKSLTIYDDYGEDRAFNLSVADVVRCTLGQTEEMRSIRRFWGELSEHLLVHDVERRLQDGPKEQESSG